jgi:hypothetical protein
MPEEGSGMTGPSPLRRFGSTALSLCSAAELVPF